MARKVGSRSYHYCRSSSCRTRADNIRNPTVIEESSVATQEIPTTTLPPTTISNKNDDENKGASVLPIIVGVLLVSGVLFTLFSAKRE